MTKIFILPPSKNELKKRLYERDQDRNTTIEKRLKSYERDSLHWNEYDFIILNDKLEICYNQIEKIINSRKKIIICSRLILLKNNKFFCQVQTASHLVVNLIFQQHFCNY